MRANFCKLLLLFAGAAVVARAQLDYVVVLAPSVRLTAGDTMQLQAGVFSPQGMFSVQPVFWRVNDPAIATIDSSGNLTGVSLGIVRVTAQWPNANIHDVLIQVVPDHVAISPPSAQLMIGDNVQFKATAFDKGGKPISNVKFTWSITSTDDDSTPAVPYGKISDSGLLTGAYEGSAYVRALYTYNSPLSPSGGGTQPGMEARIPLYAPFVTSAPRPFQVKRLFNATRQPRQNPTFRARPSPLWAAPDGRLLFNASLDGVGAALMAWDGTRFQPVIAAGTPSNSPGSIVTDLGKHSLTASGSLMTQQSATDNAMVQIGTADGLQPLLVTNNSAAGVENLNSFNTTRNSLSSQGFFVFTGWFRIPGTATFVNGLFRGSGFSVNEVLFSQADNLPELGGPGVFVGDFGVDNNGVAWYVAAVPGKTTLYRHDFNGRQKFLAVGDPLLGSSVKSFFGARTTSTPATFVAENGDVIFGVSLNDGSNYLLRYTGTDPAQPAASLRVNNGTVPLSYRLDGAVLLYGNPFPNKGDGAWLWNGDSLQPVALIGKTAVNGSPIQSIESGVIDANSQVTLMIGTADNPMVVIRATADGPQVLFQAGDPAGTQVPTVLSGFVIDGRSGNPLLMTGSTSAASIAEWRDGAVNPLLSLGDRLLGAPPFPGIFPSGNAQRTANGDLYTLLPGTGIGHYSQGQWDLALRFPLKLDDGATAFSPYRIAVNNAGAIVWTSGTDKGDTRVYLSQNGQHQVICSNGISGPTAATINGQPVFSCDDYFVDDSGRIFLHVHLQGDPVQRLYVWNQGVWRLALQPNSTTIRGRIVTAANVIRPMGNHCYASLQTDAGSFISEWTDAGWTVIFAPTDLMPTGFQLTFVFSHLEANPNGDIAFVSQANPSQAVFFRRAGVLSTVLTTGRRTADGDFLVNILGMDLTSDGTIYLLALNEKDELVFYAATPA